MPVLFDSIHTLLPVEAWVAGGSKIALFISVTVMLAVAGVTPSLPKRWGWLRMWQPWHGVPINSSSDRIKYRTAGHHDKRSEHYLPSHSNVCTQRMTLDLVVLILCLAWGRVAGLISALHCRPVVIRTSYLHVDVPGLQSLAAHILLLHGLWRFELGSLSSFGKYLRTESSLQRCGQRSFSKHFWFSDLCQTSVYHVPITTEETHWALPVILLRKFPCAGFEIRHNGD